jgi:hypothetical protein
MHYIIYKTTNLVNGNFYIGYHSTNNLDDKYLGSGKLLRLAINKYNIDKFKKEILFIFDTKEEALLKEREVVNPDFIKRNDVYNVKYGGEGGWEHTWYDKRRYDAWRKVNKGWSMTFEKRSKLFLGKNNGMYGKKQSSAMKERMKLNQILDNLLRNMSSTKKRRIRKHTEEIMRSSPIESTE